MGAKKETRDPLNKFMYGLKSEESRRQYPRRFKMFLDFLELKGSLDEQAQVFLHKSTKNMKWVEDEFIDFIGFQKERVRRGEICESTIRNYYKATKLFCEMNDLCQINWNKAKRGLPRGKQASNDRAPTVEEIRRLVEYPDRRIRPIVYTMVSSGIRLGAWDFLQWKHVKPILDKNGEVLAAKLIVYGGDPEEYYSFITPEAYDSLKDWIDFRSSYGEIINGDTWLVRDLWQTTNIKYGARLGLATIPKKLKSDGGIKRLLERALWEQGLRQPLNGKKRHEWKGAHGFRKYYKSRAEQAMKPINVEMTMGHVTGVSASYYRPTEKELLEDYIRAVPLLTINTGAKILEKQIDELKENNQDDYSKLKQELEKRKQENRITNEKVNRLLSLLVKESVDGKPVLDNELFERLVSGDEDRLQFMTTDCEYQDPIGYDVPSQDILIVRKEREKRKGLPHELK